MKTLLNEITVRLIREPNSASCYHVMYGNVCILKLLSMPSDDDIKQALHRHRESSNTTEPESARVRQLSAKGYRHSRPPDDDPFGGAAA